MPVYEYQCKACGHLFEREHAIGEKKKYRCPDCSSGRTQKIISQVGVIFKGTGFYITDNRSGNGCAGAKSASNVKTKKEDKKKKNSDTASTDSTDSADSADLLKKVTPASEN